MKKLIFLEILNRLRNKPLLMRKIKIFAAVGAVVFVVTIGLVIWAGISGLRFVTDQANQVARSPEAAQHIESIRSTAQSIPQSISKSISQMNTPACWEKAQGLFAIEPWLGKPAVENFQALKTACFDSNANPCDGSNCNQPMNEANPNVEGRFI